MPDARRGHERALDAVGSFLGCRPDARRLILGSHLDTVRNAGKYDGALGVVLPIACLRSLHERGRQLDYPIDVIAFGDEEGLRFQATLIGSRAVAGDFDPTLLTAVDEDGVRLHEAMREFGLDPDAVGDAGYRRDEVAAYVEVHIEQGPVLETEDLPIGVVTSIAGAVLASGGGDGAGWSRGDRPLVSPARGACGVSGHSEPWLWDRAQCGGGSWWWGSRSERMGTSASRDFHLRGVSSMARLAGCALMRWSTSTR